MFAKIMKGLGVVFLTAIALLTTLWFLLFVGLLYESRTTHYDQTPDENGFSYLCWDGFRKKAAVIVFYYDPTSESTEIRIPETYGKLPVLALGGHSGHGGGYPFSIRVKNAHVKSMVSPSDGSFRWYLEGSAPKDTAVIYLDFTLNLGPNIREIFARVDAAYFGTTREQGTALYIPRFYVNCDPGNSSFYSENGRLYETDGTLVEGLLYWDDDYMS